MATQKERYIPFRKRDIIGMILDEQKFKSEEDSKEFGLICEIIESIFHFSFHKDLEELKDAYFPINPDLKKAAAPSAAEIEDSNRKLDLTLQKILNDANFNVIPKEEIESAFNDNALVNFSVKIDFNDYDYARIYARGRRKDKFTVKRLFGFKTTEHEHEILERVVLFARLKKTDEQEGITFIKMFKDVPLEDLEILFPNSRVIMSLKDKLMLAVPAVAAGIPLMVTKVVPALIVAFVIISAYLGIKGTVEENQLKQAIAVFSALGALGGFLFKQWSKYKTKKFLFQKELSDNLYFRNMVNNAGVFYSLIDSAEEEECKETYLAYYFLHTAENPLTEGELDSRIEKWMQEKHGCVMDFECDDALAKLKALKLLNEDSERRYTVKPLKDSLSILDRQWDNFFNY